MRSAVADFVFAEVRPYALERWPLGAPQSSMLSVRPSLRAVLPEGTLSVGVGLALSGATTYAFLAIVARSVGPVRYAPFAGLWSLLFLLSPALFAPFEQELGRALAARRALNQTLSIVVRRCFTIAVVVVLLAVAGVIGGSGQLLSRLFDGDAVLLISLVLGLVTYCGSTLAKGTMSGSGRFGAYGGCLAVEGVFRVSMAVLLLVAGVSTPGPFAVVVAIAPLSAALFLPRRLDAEAEVDAPFPTGPLNRALWQLFVGAAFAAIIVNGAPVALKALSTDADRVAVSRFTASLLIARVPLFLFQAIQVALLPKLSAMAAGGHHRTFGTRFLRLLAFVAGIGVAATLVASTVGPRLIETVFGLGFSMKRGDLALLGVSSTLYMVALAYAQALIAYRNQGRTALAWAAGCLIFGILLLIPSDLLFRVERSLVIGTAAAALVMAVSFIDVRRKTMSVADASMGALVT